VVGGGGVLTGQRWETKTCSAQMGDAYMYIYVHSHMYKIEIEPMILWRAGQPALKKKESPGLSESAVALSI